MSHPSRSAGRKRISRPAKIAITVLILIVALIPVTVIAGRAIGHGPKPTIVLVHGAWADPAGWDQTVALLKKDGYKTVAVQLDLHTLAGDVASVHAALDGIDGKKILVGHSYGGFVVSNAATGRSDVRALVYTAAFVPDAGDTIVDLGHDYAQPAALAHLLWEGEPWASLSIIDPDFFREVFAHDLSVEQAAAMSDGQGATSPELLVTESGPVGWHDLPVYYAISGEDRIIDPALQLWMASRAGAKIIEFKKASHVGGYTVHAKQFTNLIERAVRETR